MPRLDVKVTGQKDGSVGRIACRRFRIGENKDVWIRNLVALTGIEPVFRP
jgi:hypothetical protein